MFSRLEPVPEDSVLLNDKTQCLWWVSNQKPVDPQAKPSTSQLVMSPINFESLINNQDRLTFQGIYMLSQPYNSITQIH